MPFTLSHVAAVLPLRKLNLVWSAFIIGSMAPDFLYVMGSVKYRDMGHVFPGIVEFTFPASLAALWMFQNVIKRPVIGLLPTGMQLRLRDQMSSFAFGPLSRFLAILGSIILGIASHIVWDSFTHSQTWTYRHIQWLHRWVHVPFDGMMTLTAFLQYGSSVFGLLALAVWVLLWYQRTPASELAAKYPPRSRFSLALAMFGIAAIAALFRAFVLVGVPVFHSNAHSFLLVFSITGLAVAFWQLLLYCVLVSTYQVWALN
jgi:hypothetical protein